jgi:hypothetical protein
MLILCSHRLLRTWFQRQRMKHCRVSVFSAFGGKSKPPTMRLVVDSAMKDREFYSNRHTATFSIG